MAFHSPSLLRLGVGIAIVLVAACDRSEPPSRAATPPPTPAAAPEPAPVMPPDEQVHPLYAGSLSCKPCHEKAYAAWRQSYHGMAERDVEPQGLDRETFTPRRTLQHGGQTSETFLDADGLAKVLTLGLKTERETFPV
ncbi:MAG TPA: hypothetical protein VFY13_00205, partial [Luteolibacter sp.]|nr:hypothetical protein [Luteolibacter sp.]